jgi:hypothetical protein
MWEIIISLIVAMMVAVGLIVGSVLLHRMIANESKERDDMKAKLRNMSKNLDNTIKHVNESIVSITDGESHFKKLKFKNDGPELLPSGPDCFEIDDIRYCKHGIFRSEGVMVNGLVFSQDKTYQRDFTDSSFDPSSDPGGSNNGFPSQGHGLNHGNAHMTDLVSYGMDESDGVLRMYGPSSKSHISMGFEEGHASFRDVITVSSRDKIGTREDLSTIHGDLVVTGDIQSSSLQKAIDQSNQALQKAQLALNMCKVSQES